MKRCGRCREILPLDAFYRHRSKPQGRSWDCIECNREAHHRPLPRGPVAPLLDYVTRSRVWGDGITGRDTPTNGELAAVLGVTRRTIIRWKATGLVPNYQMDRLATRLGLHPAEIWDCYDEVAT